MDTQPRQQEMRKSKRLSEHGSTAVRLKGNFPESSSGHFDSPYSRPSSSRPHSSSSSNSMDLDSIDFERDDSFNYASPSSSNSTMDDDSKVDYGFPSTPRGSARDSYMRRRYTKRGHGSSGDHHGKKVDEESVKIMRNRQAAQQFRQRQREHVSSLQEEYDRLTQENQIYKERVRRLVEQQELMNRDIAYASHFLDRTMEISMANLRASNKTHLLEPIVTKA